MLRLLRTNPRQSQGGLRWYAYLYNGIVGSDDERSVSYEISEWPVELTVVKHDSKCEAQQDVDRDGFCDCAGTVYGPYQTVLSAMNHAQHMFHGKPSGLGAPAIGTTGRRA